MHLRCLSEREVDLLKILQSYLIGISELMDGWIDEWMVIDGWINGLIDKWINGLIKR